MLTPYIHTDADRRAETVNALAAELDRIAAALPCNEATLLACGRYGFIHRGETMELDIALADTVYLDPRISVAEQIAELLEGWARKVRGA